LYINADEDDEIMKDMIATSPNRDDIISERYCTSLLKDKRLSPGADIPNECYRFSSVRASLIRRDSKREDHAVAFAGMDPGSAIKAMSAREQGHPHEAQITRRLTSRSKPADSSWFE
jgi:hypothetical protein